MAKKKIEKKMGKTFIYNSDDIIDGKGVFVDEDSTVERDDGDFVNYEGKDLKELHQSYMNAVDDYIKIRREIDERYRLYI